MRNVISRVCFIAALAVAPACGDGGGDDPPTPDAPAATADAVPTTLYQRLGEEALHGFAPEFGSAVTEQHLCLHVHQDDLA